MLGLLPLTPGPADPVSIAVAVSFGAMLLASGQTNLPKRITPVSGLALTLFLSLGFLSVFIAQWYGTSWVSWFRGLVPFLFLSSYYCIHSMETIEDVEDALDCIQAASFVWAARILVIAGPAVLQVLTGQLGRLTYACMDTLVPFGLIGYLLALTNPSRRFTKYRWFLLPLFAMFVITCAYRSHIILCVAATAVVLYRSQPIVLFRCILGCIAAGIPVYWFANEKVMSLWDNVTARFQDASVEDLGSRGLEIQYAWDQFVESPVIGKGMGHQVPVYLAHDLTGSEAYLVTNDSVGYIHNVWLYMLMDTGILGLLLYVAFFLTPVLAAWRCIWQRGRLYDLQFSALVTVSLMMIYTSCQAAFRLIQFNLVLGLVVAVLCLSLQIQGASRQCGARC